jgi:hypothetical protein
MHVVHVVGENLPFVKQGLACSAWHGAGCSAFGGVKGHRQPDNTASMRTAAKNVKRFVEASGSAVAGFKSGFKAGLQSGTAPAIPCQGCSSCLRSACIRTCV